MLGTSSSEAVLPRMIAKLENLGCEESVVGLVIPTGYSFNLDGTCIYLTMAALFLAQATNTDLIAGAAARHPRRAAADLQGCGGRDRQRLHRSRRDARSSVGTIPVASIALILGIDRFMSEARALTNLIGNGVGDRGGRQVGGGARHAAATTEPRSHQRCRSRSARKGTGLSNGPRFARVLTRMPVRWLRSCVWPVAAARRGRGPLWEPWTEPIITAGLNALPTAAGCPRLPD